MARAQGQPPPGPPPNQRLPHNLEAEAGVVGCLLKGAHPELVENGLKSADFVDPGHAIIFEAAAQVRAEGATPDLATIWQRLQSSAVLPDGEGLPYLRALAASLASPGNWKAYAKDVADCARRRRQIETADRLRKAAMAGDDVSGILAELSAAGAERSALTAIRCDLLTECTDPDLIDGVLPSDGLVLFVGASKAGKTFVEIDIGMAVARGVPWRGRAVLSGAVLCVAVEGGRRFPRRVAAYLRHHGVVDPPPFYVMSGPVDLFGGGDVATIIAAARRITAESGLPVRLVIIDTLNRSMPGADENGAADMGVVVSNLQRVAEATRGTVAAVHHLGKDASRGARGHSSLFAAVDGEVTVTAEDNRPRTITVTKCRDGEAGARFGFDLLPVGLSCVAVETDEPAPAPGKCSKLTKAAEIALGALREAINLDGEIPPKSRHMPEHVRCVRLDVWRRYCEAVQITAANKADAKRMAFKRSSEILQTTGTIGKWGDWVWIANTRT